MSHHSIRRDSRGTVAAIDGSCGSDECPTEDVDDDSIRYVCPVSGDTLATVDFADVPDLPNDLRPARIDELLSDRRRRRR